MRERSRRPVVVIGLLLGCLLPASADVVAQEPATGISPTSVPVEPSTAVVVPPGFRPILVEDLDRIEQGGVSIATLARYEVSEPTARQVARGYVLSRGYLDEPLTECLYLPKLDLEGHIIGHFFLFSSLPECTGYEALVEYAGSVVAQARNETAPSAASSAWQLRAHELSAEQFYSITISGYQFRPPLDLGHQGLPLFLLDAASVPSGCGEAPRPDAIVLAHQDTLYEAVRYLCQQGPVLYSHYAGREMDMGEALFTDIEVTLSDWRLSVLDPTGPGLPGLQRLNQRWSTYLEAGSQSGQQQ